MGDEVFSRSGCQVEEWSGNLADDMSSFVVYLRHLDSCIEDDDGRPCHWVGIWEGDLEAPALYLTYAEAIFDVVCRGFKPVLVH